MTAITPEEPALEAPAPGTKLEDHIHDLDAEPASPAKADDEPAAEGAETVKAEDTKAKADESVETEPAEDSDEDKPSERKSRTAREKARFAAVMAENEELKRLVPKADDAASLRSAVENEIGPPPKESEFADYLAFNRAMTVYEMRAANKGDEFKQKAAQAAELRDQANNEAVETFKELADEARGRINDFDAVLNAATVSPQHPEVIRAIISSAKAPELAYYLAKNPKTVHRINNMPPMAAAVELGRVEASLSKVAPSTVTKAPNPVAPLHGSSRPASKDPDKMSFEEYKAFRKSGGGN